MTQGSIAAAHPELLPPGVYQSLRRLASRRLAAQANDHSLQPTALVHEAWLRLARRNRAWQDDRHFYATAALAMRHILIDHARRRTVRHGGSDPRADAVSPGRSEAMLAVDEGITALQQQNPDRAAVVVARFFGGMSTQEIADSLRISPRSVERHWALAKVWLARWLANDTAPTAIDPDAHDA